MMDQMIAGFSKQIRSAIEIGEKAKLTKASAPILNMVVSGLGGSGIGATMVRDLIGEELSIPMIVNKNYDIPAFVDNNTLVVISSYSGNTEETLEALDHAVEKNAKIICISSGGKISDFAQKHGLDLITIKGTDSPRANLSLSLVQILYILNFNGFIADTFRDRLQDVITMLDFNDEQIRAKGKELAESLHDKLPIIYAPSGYEGTAIRWRQQINENGKMLAWHHVIPEMNHNELVGWRTKDDNLAVIFFDIDDVYDRIKTRIRINKEITEKYTKHVYEIDAMGSNKFEKTFYLTYLGDWLSFYLSEKRGVDAVEVDVIDFLKGELAKS